MDDTDYQILNILQGDSRTTLRTIGGMVGLTSPAVAERIRKMEASGVIQNFSVRVDRARINCRILGFSLVALAPKVYDEFCLFCRREPAVICHYHLVGVFNAMIRFAVSDTQSLDALLQKIKTFGNSRTSIELCTYFDCKDLAPCSNVLSAGKQGSIYVDAGQSRHMPRRNCGDASAEIGEKKNETVSILR